MKGKPVSDNGNAVVWANGFKSNMPDWSTARACSVASEMLHVLKRSRSMLLKYDKYIDDVDLDAVIKLVQDVCEKADGTAVFCEALSQPAIPKPPGFA